MRSKLCRVKSLLGSAISVSRSFGVALANGRFKWNRRKVDRFAANRRNGNVGSARASHRPLASQLGDILQNLPRRDTGPVCNVARHDLKGLTGPYAGY